VSLAYLRDKVAQHCLISDMGLSIPLITAAFVSLLR